MNRIILVGNGFDLAHGLPTSYKDFIKWYWSSWVETLASVDGNHCQDKLVSFDTIHPNGVWQLYIESFKSEDHSSDLSIISKIKQQSKNKQNFKITYISGLFERLNNAIDLKGWVDVEEEYYTSLKNSNDARQLNAELSFIKDKLIEYLTLVTTTLEEYKSEDYIRHVIKEPIKSKDISVEASSLWTAFITTRLNFSESQWSELLINYVGRYFVKESYEDTQITKRRIDQVHNKTGNLKNIPDVSYREEFFYPDRIMLLNFNYTDVADAYLNTSGNFVVNHIHGELSNATSVIFGYGDELDDGYASLTKCNDNELLRNIKSIRYQESGRYRQLLQFIDSAPFQIYIMGHSCGNSDRTLLNTLFEHKNCVSIKPFFHRKDDASDNYLDIVQNISRNFTDMKKMRDRVVNKTYCEPLPQLKKAVNDNE